MATSTLVVAANIPDVDIFAFARGPYFALAVRRGITHGWPAMLVWPFVVTALVLAWDRWIRRAGRPDRPRPRAGPVFGLAAVGVISHPVLDWMNTYGMRWSLPFDAAWSYGDALFIIDPWLWLALGGATFLATPDSRSARWFWGLLALATSAVVVTAPGPAAVKGLWAAGLGAVWALRSRVRSSAGFARGTLVAAMVYISVSVAANHAASDAVARHAARTGIQALEVMVSPLPGDPFTGEVEVRTERGYVPGVHRWFRRPRVTLDPTAVVPYLSASGIPSEEVQNILRHTRDHPDIRDYLVWSRYPFTRVERDPLGWRVRVGDARYDRHREAGALGGLEVVIPDTVSAP